MSIREYNRIAWDNQVERNNRWTTPVSSKIINAARQGDWQVLLTETKSVPRDWFPELKELDLLCLASGGGQQAPIFAAAGANVTVLDTIQATLGPIWMGVMLLIITVPVIFILGAVLYVGFRKRSFALALLPFALLGAYWLWLVKLISEGAFD